MKTKEAIEWVEELDYNPYPEDVFLPIPQEQYDKIHELLKKEMGMPIDRLMGHIGRKLRKNIFYDINKMDIISLLQQGEALKAENTELKAYKQMWEELYEISSEFNFFPLMDRIKQKHFPKEG